MQTLLQTLKWPTPAAVPLTLPGSGDPRRQALSPQEFRQRLSSGDWSRIGEFVKWFTCTSAGAIQEQPYAQWRPAMQHSLYTAYVDYLRAYLASEGGDLHFPFLDRPPANLANTSVKTWLAYTACSEQDAFALFVGFAGHGLAVEQLGFLPWSLKSLDNYSLMDLFDASRLFSVPGTTPSQYMLSGAVPCAASTAARFVQKNGILCQTMIETIGQLIRWCKRLTHKERPSGVTDIYGNDDFQWSQDFFGYRGAPSVAAMLKGTIYSGTDPGWKAAYPGLMHWTRGCHSTAVLIQSVLRAVNIPVFCIDNLNPAWVSMRGPKTVNAGDHASCYFRNSQRVLAHADHPYELAGRMPDILPFPPEALTVHASEFLPLALLSYPSTIDITERPLALLRAQFLTKSAVLAHYQARRAGQPAGSAIPSFNSGSTPGATIQWWEAETIGTGTLLDALVEPYLGDADDSRLKADLNSIPSW